MNQQIKIKVFGRVQGVFFRYSAKIKADELGIKGFARNMPDGSIEIIVQGNDDALDKFMEWIKEGPELAKVEKVDVSHLPRQQAGETLKTEFKDFSIK